tara:strand:+ start:6516 stop:7634 length:1119 start_codon:yes stop_codon:yes gene_type:complete
MAENIQKTKIKIAIIAGELSGDELGAPLMHSIKAINPSIEFIGVGGPKMISEGLDTCFNINEISVMGIIEPLLNLRRLLKLRKQLKEYFIKEKPDLFIGIDSPDFNLPIAKFLKKNTGIKAIQYVSPSVWAWRKGRIKSMENSIDSVLTLFPFEESAYLGSKIKVSYVGHPLSYKIKMSGSDIEDKISNSIALLPGSRKSEIKLMGDTMIKAAKELRQINPEYKFFMPLSDQAHLNLLQEDLEGLINISFSNSQEVLKKSELAIITSGTATLESILAFTPCLTLYKTNWLTYLIIKPLLSIDFFALPNLISGNKILPELLQKDVTIKNIIYSIDSIKEKGSEFYNQKFNQIIEDLKAGGANKASVEVLKLLN